MAANIVCIDTTILSLFFKTEREKNTTKEEQADFLIRKLEKEKQIVCIPTIVVGELLYSVPDDKMFELHRDITKLFVTHPFDDMAAFYFREIALQKRNPVTDAPRWSRAADAKILATAMSCGAKCVYSGDDRMGLLAPSKITVLQLPPLPPRQASLPMPEHVMVKQ